MGRITEALKKATDERVTRIQKKPGPSGEGPLLQIQKSSSINIRIFFQAVIFRN